MYVSWRTIPRKEGDVSSMAYLRKSVREGRKVKTVHLGYLTTFRAIDWANPIRFQRKLEQAVFNAVDEAKAIVRMAITKKREEMLK